MARLGYARYGAAGSDWGTTVSTRIGLQDRAHVAGIHVVPPLALADPATLDDLTPAEQAALADLERGDDGDGYSHQQSTPAADDRVRPRRLPRAAVRVEREKVAWTDSGGRPESVLTRDELLDNLMLYWLPGTGASAARLYWESFRGVQEIFRGPVTDVVDVPTGCSVFPRENPRPSRRWAEARFRDIRHWGEPDRGGHFAAFEQPELFVDELRAFFRLVR